MPLTEAEEFEFELERQKQLGKTGSQGGLTNSIIQSQTSSKQPPNTLYGIAEALMPRRTKMTGDESFGKKVSALGLDVASLPFRGAAATIGAGAKAAGWMSGGGKLKDLPLKDEFVQSLGQTGGTKDQGGLENTAETILRDPANALPGIAPFKAAKLGAKVANSALMGGASAGTHQLENYASGQEVSPEMGLAEMLANIAAPQLGSAIKKGAAGASEKIMNVAVKVPKSMRKKNAIDFQKAFDAGIRPGIIGNSLENMQGKFQKEFKQMGEGIKEVVKNADASGQKVNLYEIINKELPAELAKKPELFPIRSNLDKQYEDLINNLSTVPEFSKNELLPSDALKLKRIVGKEGSWVNSYNKSGALTSLQNPDATAKEIVYNEFFKKINEKLKTVTDPQFQALNKKFSELIPLERAVSDRVTSKKNLETLSLSDLLAGGLLGGTAGMMGETGYSPMSAVRGMTEGNLKPLGYMLAGIAGNKALRSPKTASGLNRLSKMRGASPAISNMGGKIARNTMFGQNEEEE